MPPNRCIALLVLFAAAVGPSEAVPTYIPTRIIRRNGSDPNADVIVVFQPVDMELHAIEPSRFPMFAALLRFSPKNASMTRTWKQLKHYLDTTSEEEGRGLFAESTNFSSPTVGTYAAPVPAGFIYHEARVGSTLAANSTRGSRGATAPCRRSLKLSA